MSARWVCAMSTDSASLLKDNATRSESLRPLVPLPQGFGRYYARVDGTSAGAPGGLGTSYRWEVGTADGYVVFTPQYRLVITCSGTTTAAALWRDLPVPWV